MKYLNRIKCLDAIELMQEIPSESVDLVLTDPPYGISKEMTINRGSQGKFKGNDLTSDYGEWDKFSELDYLAFTDSWVEQAERILRPGGTLISFFDKRKISYLYDRGEWKGLFMRDEVAWIKSNPVPQVRKVKYAQAVEVAGIMHKPGGRFTFNWELGYHPNYIKAPIVGGHERLKDEEGKTLHPTQKPLVVMQWLIDYWSVHGDLVVDPFCGVGTVPAICVMMGREFIAGDNNQEYVTAATDRVAFYKTMLAGRMVSSTKHYPYYFYMPVMDYMSDEYKEKHR